MRLIQLFTTPDCHSLYPQNDSVNLSWLNWPRVLKIYIIFWKAVTHWLWTEFAVPVYVVQTSGTKADKSRKTTQCQVNQRAPFSYKQKGINYFVRCRTKYLESHGWSVIDSPNTQLHSKPCVNYGKADVSPCIVRASYDQGHCHRFAVDHRLWSITILWIEAQCFDCNDNK